MHESFTFFFILHTSKYSLDFTLNYVHGNLLFKKMFKIDKRVSEKNNHITAIKTFNQLPNELKTLEIDKRSTVFKLKKWIVNNIY